MQNPVKERIAKLREEIAQISEANRLYLQGRNKAAAHFSRDQCRLDRIFLLFRCDLDHGCIVEVQSAFVVGRSILRNRRD